MASPPPRRPPATALPKARAQEGSSPPAAATARWGPPPTPAAVRGRGPKRAVPLAVMGLGSTSAASAKQAAAPLVRSAKLRASTAVVDRLAHIDALLETSKFAAAGVRGFGECWPAPSDGEESARLPAEARLFTPPSPFLAECDAEVADVAVASAWALDDEGGPLLPSAARALTVEAEATDALQSGADAAAAVSEEEEVVFECEGEGEIAYEDAEADAFAVCDDDGEDADGGQVDDACAALVDDAHDAAGEGEDEDGVLEGVVQMLVADAIARLVEDA